MRTIKIKTDVLKETLIKNKENHTKQFEEAWEGYCKFAAKELEKRLEAAKERKSFQIYIEVSVPENHTEDYERAIKMLDLHVEDTISLDSNEYTQYFEDKWRWSGKFQSDNATYSAIDIESF